MTATFHDENRLWLQLTGIFTALKESCLMTERFRATGYLWMTVHMVNFVNGHKTILFAASQHAKKSSLRYIIGTGSLYETCKQLYR